MKVLILAGGEGLRLWPLSLKAFPKQFLRFGEDFSLLQKTVQRFLSAPFVEEIAIATHQQYQNLVEAQLSPIDPEKRVGVFCEPMRKNTAAAILLGVKYFEEKAKKQESSVILVLPSDHLIEPAPLFLRSLQEALSTSEQKSNLILFGIQPTRPETGYGYIQLGPKIEGPLHSVLRFVEKPNLSKAEEFLASGEYYWNAGIFAFSLRVFWEELSEHAPEFIPFRYKSFSDCLEDFELLPSISIDYALIEKMKRLAICPLPIRWSDIGCWDSVYETLAKDENQNVKIGNVLDIATKNSLILGGKKLISTVGLDDLLIVDTADATFIGKKGESQRVKELAQQVSALHLQSNDEKVKLLYSEPGLRITLYLCSASSSIQAQEEDAALQIWFALSGTLHIEWQEESLQQNRQLSAFDSVQFRSYERVLLKNFFSSCAQAVCIAKTDNT